MIHLLGLLCLVHCVQYVTSQITMVESGPGTVKPTETLEMTCKVSGASLTDSTNMYGVHWIRQSERKQMEWLGAIWHDASTSYGTPVKGRLTLSRDTNKGEVFLKLTGMKTEESGKYYCARYATSWAFDIWGLGTQVAVTSASPSVPSLFPLISCGTSQEQSTTIGCLARNFLPESIEFSFADKANSSFSTGFKKYNPVLQSGGNYAASSQIQVLTTSWESSDAYYCTAKHPQGTRTVLLQIPHASRKPIVTIHPPVKDDIELNDNATIACIAHGFSPKIIEVKWLKNHNVPVIATTEEAVSDGNGGFIITSFIVVSKKDWDTDITFSCIVNHSASGFYEMKNVSKSTVCEPNLPADIRVTAVPPLFETIYLQNIAPLTCIISNMENRDGLEVTWYANSVAINTEIEDPVYDTPSRKYTAKAIATVCPEDWKTKTFECRVTHPELPRVVVVTLNKPNGHDAKTPTVLLFPPHQDELAKKETATLSCLVKGFAPADIFVKWMDSDNVEQSHVVTTKPMEEITSSSKKTYFLFSTLTLTNVEDWNNGKSYTCIVGHESLPLYTTQRTIDKTAAQMIYIEEDDDIDNLWTTASTFIVLFLLSLFYSATVTLFKVK